MTLVAALETYQAFSRRSVVLEPLLDFPTTAQLEDAAASAYTYGAAIVDAGDLATEEDSALGNIEEREAIYQQEAKAKRRRP